MGFFGFLKRNKTRRPGENHNNGDLPEISKAMFVEEQEPLENMDMKPDTTETKGVEEIYFFLQKDYESRGYNDALTNPDDSYRIDNLNLLKHDLSILVQRVTTYYEDMLRELDFHILTRGRAGLVDLVETLKTRKELVEDHLKKVNQIKADLENSNGTSQRIILSYQRGFMRGLSAITTANILKKEF